MWQSKNRTQPLILGLLLGAIASFPTHGADTEVFMANLSAQSSALLRPNVMFVIDTSGSMSGVVTGTAFPYDPSITYAGACVTTRVYWSNTGTTPDCTTTQFFNLSQLRCAASGREEDQEQQQGAAVNPVDHFIFLSGAPRLWLFLGPTPRGKCACPLS